MAIKSRKQVRAFIAKADDGTLFNLSEWVTVTEGEQAIEGPSEFLTAGGHYVDRISKGHYRIMPNGMELSSDDPDAP